jgi:hypothetical protein
MEQLDLDINNYNLDDVLKLFGMPYDFTSDDMKQAKKVVLMTHPDKSGLDQKYFLFFSSAYKIIHKIYEFRYKSQNKNTEYRVEKNEEHNEILKRMNHNDPKNFNKWFNEMFETMQIKDDNKETGYGDWLNSNEGIDDRKATKANMNEMFETKKKEMKSIVVKKDVQELNYSGSGNYSDLVSDKPDYYSSDVFSKLQYEDVKRAHTETVVPVTMEDYLNKKKYNNINELQTERSIQESTRLSDAQALQYLKNKKDIETKSDIERAYKLAKQDEEVRKLNNNWWSKLKQIAN